MASRQSRQAPRFPSVLHDVVLGAESSVYEAEDRVDEHHDVWTELEQVTLMIAALPKSGYGAFR